ncbi:MAG: hypothetical protein R2705_21260 [Ilumatobacteraceae bacterium]
MTANKVTELVALSAEVGARLDPASIRSTRFRIGSLLREHGHLRRRLEILETLADSLVGSGLRRGAQGAGSAIAARRSTGRALGPCLELLHDAPCEYLPADTSRSGAGGPEKRTAFTGCSTRIAQAALASLRNAPRYYERALERRIARTTSCSTC